ncbi:MAG TPA: hypothetical protein PLS24_01080 [Sedimentisphaerales bacterium]|nr:hypothetical protein [Phycisphaerae bacterium]HON91501.1 hypothetical protein [Sedimentisphaerales bacterium]HOV76594.1 hypothetical protein [Sedimentisphaerales bacterium]HQI27053.1 hypothetical protein [Sedimentisphaerales bacterium]
MSTADSRAKLVQATKKLLSDWQRVREVWRDDNCLYFDKKYITPLEASIRAATVAMERMAGLIDRAEHDCRDAEDPAL